MITYEVEMVEQFAQQKSMMRGSASFEGTPQAHSQSANSNSSFVNVPNSFVAAAQQPKAHTASHSSYGHPNRNTLHGAQALREIVLQGKH